jgi:KDO2-lipid IV(A) lauroyltransferase
MGIEVPVHTGAEMLAKKYDLNVIFASKKVGRGYYECTLIPIDNPTWFLILKLPTLLFRKLKTNP